MQLLPWLWSSSPPAPPFFACRYDGTFEQVLETTTAGVTIQAPQLDIDTVAAGGGSKLHFTNGLFAVGPDSCGADPGPVCYRCVSVSLSVFLSFCLSVCVFVCLSVCLFVCLFVSPSISLSLCLSIGVSCFRAFTVVPVFLATSALFFI